MNEVMYFLFNSDCYKERKKILDTIKQHFEYSFQMDICP